MKIAMVVSTFPPDVGGMGQVVHEETTRLVAHGHQVTVFALRYCSAYIETLSVQRLSAWPRWGDAGFVPSLIWRLRGFDMVHFHYPFYGAGLAVLLARWLFKMQLVITYHMDARPGLCKRVIQWLADLVVTPLLFRAAHRVVVPDLDYGQQAKYGSFKFQELPNGVDANLFSPGSVDWSRLTLPVVWKEKKIILFVGNLLPIKRLDLVLEAMKLSNDPAEVLAVIGGGYAEEQLRAKVKEFGLSERVVFVGRMLDQREMVGYYRAARVVVIPSDVESFSLVALEAMASAKAVIASAIPGLRRRVVDGSTGFLFTPGSAQSLRSQLDAFFALSVQQQTAFGQAAREFVVRDYTWDQHSAMLEQYYR